MDLERVRQAHSEILSIISHDIRAPLGVILGALTELSNPQVGELNDEQRVLVQLVRRSSEKLSRLANNIMILNRMETARVELAQQPVDMRLIAQRALDAVERSGERGKLALASRAPDEAAIVFVDAERIGQVLANMLANALRFARREVRLGVEASAAHVDVVVEDDGPGLTSDAIPLLFERAQSAPAGRPPSGLGLFVVKGIVDAHGATVHAENIGDEARPQGARFRVTFARHGARTVDGETK
jgi:signal transduction histidine kinase